MTANNLRTSCETCEKCGLAEQVGEVLKEGMRSGRWRGTLPGRNRLAAELGVSHKTVETAMRRLAEQELLVSEGGGKRRRIVLPEGEVIRRELRVWILTYDRDSRQHLARRGVHAPQDDSLISSDKDLCLEWCDPAISCFRWDPAPEIKRIVQWIKNVAAQRKEDKRQVLFEGEFVQGGTIGPVPVSGKMGSGSKS